MKHCGNILHFSYTSSLLFTRILVATNLLHCKNSHEASANTQRKSLLAVQSQLTWSFANCPASLDFVKDTSFNALPNHHRQPYHLCWYDWSWQYMHPFSKVWLSAQQHLKTAVSQMIQLRYFRTTGYLLQLEHCLELELYQLSRQSQPASFVSKPCSSSFWLSTRLLAK